MKRIAKVAVDLSLDREFDYLIPESLQAIVEMGVRVEVPFGKRQVNGFVVGLAEESDVENLKPIGKVLGEQSLITEPVMELARWISSYYLAPFENCVRAVLPAVVRRKTRGEKQQLMVSLVDQNATRAVRLPKENVDAVSSPRLFEFDSSQPVSHSSGGNLPHWRQDGTTYFVTFRLADSLPQEKLKRWKQERDEWLADNPKPNVDAVSPPRSFLDEKRGGDTASTPDEKRGGDTASTLEEWQHEYHACFTEKFERWLDAGSGGCVLKNPDVRAILEASLRHFCGKRYGLHSYVIMPNHVHVLVTPFGEHTLSKIIKGWKSVSTREINKLREERREDTAPKIKKSNVVWQKESFDHIVRNTESLEKITRYMDENPKELDADCYSLYSLKRDGDIASTLTPKQQAVIDVLKKASPVFLSELMVRTDGSAGTVKTLKKKGWVTISKESIYRDPHAGVELLKTEPLNLMPQQAEALEKIIQIMDSEEPKTLLLHGVTGSGKTEVYLQAIAHAVERGQGAIVLVPEIALTPQTVDRFRARFADKPERVAVLHSSLSDGERYDEWHRIRSGEARIVAGARSALFAPVMNLGLIVVDEEHEPTYKQGETPRYSARDTAVMRGQRESCTVVLGSATPALESYRNAQIGKYLKMELTSRVDHRRMPVMRIIDMRIEAQREGRPHLFSKELIEAIYSRLHRAEQTLIFLNRRGFSSSLVCPDCGDVSECEQCSVSMSYHKSRARLICHICGDERSVPADCPQCHSHSFKYSGAGTEKIEEVMTKLFPKACIARMDSDTMRRKNAHRDLLTQFRLGKIDILIGTQMIAKGLDFPNVTLVGVVNPDHALHMADFRAGERVFHLLTQVAGRAGRGEVEGEVIVQTYTPHHPAIQAARRMDFEGFCDQELAFRQELSYPPYAHLTCITLRGKQEQEVEVLGERFFQGLQAATLQTGALRRKNDIGLQDSEKGTVYEVLLSPPVPAPIHRIRGEYRVQILMRAERTGAMTRAIRRAIRAIDPWPKGVKCTIDVDATSLL